MRVCVSMQYGAFRGFDAKLILWEILIMFKHRCILNELLWTAPGKRRKTRGRKDQRRSVAVHGNDCVWVCNRWNIWRWILPPSSCICTLPGYCSFLKTGPTAGKPVAIFRAKQNIVRRTIFTEHTGQKYFCFPTLKGMLLSSKMMSCPQQQEVILLSLSNMPVSLCAMELDPSVKASINIPLDVLRSAQAEATRDESELIHIH